MDSPVWPIVWTACGVVTLVASIFAARSRRARCTGRIATMTLFVFGGALVHLINLVNDADYANFADPALFGWVTDAWRAVVPPNVVFLIGLLAAFELTVGVLAVCGGRWTRLAYGAVIAFYLALWLFGWIEAIWCLVMVPPMALLLRAEWRASRTAADADEGAPAAPAPAVETQAA